MNSILLQLMALVYGTKGTVKTQPVTQRPISLSCIAIHESPEFFFFIRKQFSGKTFPYFAQEQKMFYMPFVLCRVAHKWYLCTTDISMAPTTSQIYDECQSQPAKVWAMMPGNIICQTIPTTPLIFDVSFKLATLCWV